MATKTLPLNRCTLCNGAERDEVNKRLRRGDTAQAVSNWLASQGIYRSSLTVRKHRNLHLTSEAQRELKAKQRELVRQSKTLKPVSETDLAVLVRDRVISAVAEEGLAPTVSEGLRAQELLDKRAERGADRSLALRFAAVIAGAFAPAGVVEGEYVDVDGVRGLPAGTE